MLRCRISIPMEDRFCCRFVKGTAEMKRYFEISTHVLVGTAFTALAMTGRLDAASIVIFSAALIWSLFRTTRQLPALLNARATVYLSCAYIVFFIVDAVALSGSFIPATVH